MNRDATEFPKVSDISAPAVGSRGSGEEKTPDSQLNDSTSEPAPQPTSKRSTRKGNRGSKNRKYGSGKNVDASQQGSEQESGSSRNKKLQELLNRLPPENKAGWAFPDGMCLEQIWITEDQHLFSLLSCAYITSMFVPFTASLDQTAADFCTLFKYDIPYVEAGNVDESSLLQLHVYLTTVDCDLAAYWSLELLWSP